MNPEDWKALLKEIEDAGDAVEWKRDETIAIPEGAYAQAFIGTANGYKFAIVRWEIPGRGGVDGSAANHEKKIVFHLTPALVEKFFEAAVRQNPPAKCTIIASPSYEGGPDVECAKPVKVGFTICEDCYNEMKDGDTSVEELAAWYGVEAKHG